MQTTGLTEPERDAPVDRENSAERTAWPERSFAAV